MVQTNLKGMIVDTKKTHHVIIQGIDKRTGKPMKGSKTIQIRDCPLTIEQLTDIIRNKLKEVRINV